MTCHTFDAGGITPANQRMISNSARNPATRPSSVPGSDNSETDDRSANFGLIPARGGSQGVPGKNIRPLAGIPLIAHSIKSAIASGVFDDVYVSTDNEEVADISLAYGARVIARPADLAQADTPTAPVVEHAVEWFESERGDRPDRVFLLEPTSPFRRPSDIRAGASILEEGGCDAVLGVAEANDPPQWSLLADSDGLLRPAAGRDQYLSRRQDLPSSYLSGPLYAIRTAAFLEQGGFLTDRTRFFVVPAIRAIDIDTEMDFLFAEFVLERGHAII